MRRRAFITLLGAIRASWQPVARAQQAKVTVTAQISRDSPPVGPMTKMTIMTVVATGRTKEQ